VSIAPSTAWHAARTTVTVEAYFSFGEYSTGSATYATTTRAEQFVPEPVPGLGSVAGSFVYTDDLTGDDTGVVVDLQQVSPLSVPPLGTLRIKSGYFAGTYEPSNLYFGVTSDGVSYASIQVQLSNGNWLAMSLGADDGGQSASVNEWAPDWSTVLHRTVGPVTKKGFTIVMPAE
jgi:hypothetical protein